MTCKSFFIFLRNSIPQIVIVDEGSHSKGAVGTVYKPLRINGYTVFHTKIEPVDVVGYFGLNKGE